MFYDRTFGVQKVTYVINKIILDDNNNEVRGVVKSYRRK